MSNLMLSSHLNLDLLNCIFRLCFPAVALCTLIILIAAYLVKSAICERPIYSHAEKGVIMSVRKKFQ